MRNVALALGALWIGIIVLAGCTSAEQRTSEEKFVTKYVDGTRCIIWVPSQSEPAGSQMECDFGGRS